MNDLRDRIAQALSPEALRARFEPGGLPDPYDLTDAVMPIVAELAADLDHAERHNRRLQTEIDRLKRD